VYSLGGYIVMGVSIEKYRKIQNRNIVKFKVIESFSGPGGMSLGLSYAGFELLFAFDSDKKSVETHNYNLGNKCVQENVYNVKGKDILRKLNLKKGELDLFAGGPPCQGFSKQKKGAHLGDKRNQLILEYIRLIDEISPKFFIFENVAIFGQKRGKKYIDEMITKFSNYMLHPHFYNSADYGLAQTRERFVIVGQRKDLVIPFIIPKPTVSVWKTIKDVIGDLPEPPSDYSVHSKYHNHQKAKISELNIKRFSFVPEGGGWQNIPDNMKLKCHLRIDTTKGGWPDVYGRLKMNGQCPTITGGFDNFSRGRYGHPISNRPITPREAARIQGFPDNFVFFGNRGDVRKQIGNAVPPPLAKVIGKQIAKCLELNNNANIDFNTSHTAAI